LAALPRLQVIAGSAVHTFKSLLAELVAPLGHRWQCIQVIAGRAIYTFKPSLAVLTMIFEVTTGYLLLKSVLPKQATS